MSLTQRICLLILVPVAFSILSGLITNSTPQDSTEKPLYEEEEKVDVTVSRVVERDIIANVCKSSEKTESENDNIRPTPVCNEISADVLEKLDAAVSPCDDFYKFACGGFIKNTVIPGDRSNENLFTILADKVQAKLKKIVEAPITADEIKPFQYVKQFYQKCVNETDIELNSIASAKKILNQIGNWPVLQGEEWKSDEFDINNVTYKMRQIGLPFDNIISVTANKMINASKNSIYISYPRLSLVNELLLEGLNNSQVKAHYNFIVNISVALGAERNLARKEFNDSMLFEIQLANITNGVKKSVQNSSNVGYDEISIKDLSLLHPFIPWEDYINHMIGNESIHVNPNETINIRKLNFIGKIENLLSTTPKRVQANYIFSHILQVISPLLSKEIQNISLETSKSLHGIIEKPLRWKECFNILPDGLLKAVSALYVRNSSNISNKKLKVVELANTLKSTLISIIKESAWMDENAKLQAVEKANSMSFNIGFPNELLDDDDLERVYKDLSITPSDNALDILLKVTKNLNDRLFSIYGQTHDNSFWANDIPATSAIAKYSLFINAIHIPAILLEKESYDINKPQYMNYGGFGFFIGIGMTLGFFDEGRKYDKDGANNDWWESSTKIEFDRKSQCFVHQGNNYTIQKLNLHVNGSMTLEDNIASNSAIKTAYMAYQSWVNENGVEQALPGVNYTSNQLFWISSAQYMCSVSTEEHLKTIILTDDQSPLEFRVNGALSNSKDFAKDFNCPLGSQMNPENKCEI